MVPEDVLAGCDAIAHIPIASESLNAAMAATIALYEVDRGASRRHVAREAGPQTDTVARRA